MKAFKHTPCAFMMACFGRYTNQGFRHTAHSMKYMFHSLRLLSFFLVWMSINIHAHAHQLTDSQFYQPGTVNSSYSHTTVSGNGLSCIVNELDKSADKLVWEVKDFEGGSGRYGIWITPDFATGEVVVSSGETLRVERMKNDVTLTYSGNIHNVTLNKGSKSIRLVDLGNSNLQLSLGSFDVTSEPVFSFKSLIPKNVPSWIYAVIGLILVFGALGLILQLRKYRYKKQMQRDSRAAHQKSEEKLKRFKKERSSPFNAGEIYAPADSKNLSSEIPPQEKPQKRAVIEVRIGDPFSEGAVSTERKVPAGATLNEVASMVFQEYEWYNPSLGLSMKPFGRCLDGTRIISETIEGEGSNVFFVGYENHQADFEVKNQTSSDNENVMPETRIRDKENEGNVGEHTEKNRSRADQLVSPDFVNPGETAQRTGAQPVMIDVVICTDTMGDFDVRVLADMLVKDLIVNFLEDISETSHSPFALNDQQRILLLEGQRHPMNENHSLLQEGVRNGSRVYLRPFNNATV